MTQSLLDQPLTLRSGVVLPNRVALAPLTNTQSNPDGTLHDDEFNWLVARAGHFGLLSTCAAFVSAEGHAWHGQLGIANDAHMPGLTRLAAALTAAGSVPIVQLYHGGKQATQAPVKLSTVDGDGIRGAALADIARVTADFVAAAQRAEAAGFAGVEIHGANGYLFTQFLAPLDNPRTDDYGGDLVGRARFLREVTRAVIAATSPRFSVGVRISPVDLWSQRGLLLADSVQLAQWLAEDGVDFVHLSLGNASGPPPHEAVETPAARAIRDALSADVALLVAGGVQTAADADRAAATGADMVAVGKMAIIHPDWPSRYRDPAFAPTMWPWSADDLRAAAVSDSFINYLSAFSGLVEGAKPAR